MLYKIIVPPGIGDFHWLWCKLSTTQDSYFVEYPDTGPDRLGPYLTLLPKNKIVGYKQNKAYKAQFILSNLEMKIIPAVRKAFNYSDLLVNEQTYVEANTHLENGGRIEVWMPELKIDFHYELNGLLKNPVQQDQFIVHLSSWKMQKIWKTYDVPRWLEIIYAVQKQTNWRPIFIGADYDDFAKAVYDEYVKINANVTNFIGQTVDVLSALHQIQCSKFFLGCVSSGMTMLSNLVSIPSASWWPRPQLPTSWSDPNVPYKWFLWSDYKQDITALCKFVKSIYE